MASRFWAAILGFGLALALPIAAEAKGDCKALRAACEAAGFLNSDGTGPKVKIVRDCMDPLMAGVEAPGNGVLALPQVPDQTIEACKELKVKKGKKGDAATVGKAAGAGPARVIPLPASVEPGPNIVLILVDDMAMNLMPDNLGELARTMPNLALMRREGMTFDNYFVTNSLCCPSRTSIMTGLLPHNSGVLTNTPPDGGLAAFKANGNEDRTFAVPLHAAHYATAFMGKYLNGYDPETGGIPKGWTEWAVAGDGYANFNYTLNHNGTLVLPAPHMTDELSTLGQAFIAQVSGGPFFLELATFSPHGPFTPPARYADAFPGITYPRTPAFAAEADARAPQWMKDVPPMGRRAQKKIDQLHRLRVQSMKGIDDLIGDIRGTLEDLGLAEDTYVIFSSDNGFHQGEFSLVSGKSTPFDTDILVPLVVLGPGIAAGSRNDDIVMNIDLYPTVLDLAGLTPPAIVDGQSLVPALMGRPGPARNLAIIEHTRSDHDAGDPDASDPKAGDPPTYVALRFRDALYVEYLDGSGEVGYYDLNADPHQLRNIAHTLPRARLKALHEAALANHTCAGAAECGAAQAMRP